MAVEARGITSVGLMVVDARGKDGIAVEARGSVPQE